MGMMEDWHDAVHMIYELRERLDLATSNFDDDYRSKILKHSFCCSLAPVERGKIEIHLLFLLYVITPDELPDTRQMTFSVLDLSWIASQNIQKIRKIIHPEETEFTLLVAVILIASIVVKLYMAYYNRAIGKKLDSAAMKAVATDSLSDTVATTVVLLASVFTHFTGIKIDGYCGLVVGLLVGYAGFDAARETLNPLLGQPPAHEFVEKIDEIVMSHSEVCGMHDLIVHDYGPGRKMISLHAEVPAEGNILELHDVIDNIENELRRKLGCEATIHMDPIVTSDEHVSETKSAVSSLIKAIDKDLSIHDFRMVVGETHTNLIFDILAPFGFRLSDEELLTEVLKEVREHFGENYYVVTKVDHSYI